MNFYFLDIKITIENLQIIKAYQKATNGEFTVRLSDLEQSYLDRFEIPEITTNIIISFTLDPYLLNKNQYTITTYDEYDNETETTYNLTDISSGNQKSNEDSLSALITQDIASTADLNINLASTSYYIDRIIWESTTKFSFSTNDHYFAKVLGVVEGQKYTTYELPEDQWQEIKDDYIIKYRLDFPNQIYTTFLKQLIVECNDSPHTYIIDNKPIHLIMKEPFTSSPGDRVVIQQQLQTDFEVFKLKQGITYKLYDETLYPFPLTRPFQITLQLVSSKKYLEKQQLQIEQSIEMKEELQKQKQQEDEEEQEQQRQQTQWRMQMIQEETEKRQRNNQAINDINNTLAQQENNINDIKNHTNYNIALSPENKQEWNNIIYNMQELQQNMRSTLEKYQQTQRQNIQLPNEPEDQQFELVNQLLDYQYNDITQYGQEYVKQRQVYIKYMEYLQQIINNQRAQNEQQQQQEKRLEVLNEDKQNRVLKMLSDNITNGVGQYLQQILNNQKTQIQGDMQYKMQQAWNQLERDEDQQQLVQNLNNDAITLGEQITKSVLQNIQNLNDKQNESLLTGINEIIKNNEAGKNTNTQLLQDLSQKVQQYMNDQKLLQYPVYTQLNDQQREYIKNKVIEQYNQEKQIYSNFKNQMHNDLQILRQYVNTMDNSTPQKAQEQMNNQTMIDQLQHLLNGYEQTYSDQNMQQELETRFKQYAQLFYENKQNMTEEQLMKLVDTIRKLNTFSQVYQPKLLQLAPPQDDDIEGEANIDIPQGSVYITNSLGKSSIASNEQVNTINQLAQSIINNTSDNQQPLNQSSLNVSQLDNSNQVAQNLVNSILQEQMQQSTQNLQQSQANKNQQQYNQAMEDILAIVNKKFLKQAGCEVGMQYKFNINNKRSNWETPYTYTVDQNGRLHAYDDQGKDISNDVIEQSDAMRKNGKVKIKGSDGKQHVVSVWNILKKEFQQK